MRLLNCTYCSTYIYEYPNFVILRFKLRFNIKCIVDTKIVFYRIKNYNSLQEEHDDLHKIKECDLGHTSLITYKNITCDTINFEIVIFIK